MQFGGTLGPAAGGRLISIELLAPDGTWQRVTTTRATADGSFAASWTAPQAGRFTARAEPAAEVLAAQAVTVPLTTATVYRPATATWYDQSGRTGACGVRLRRATLGVAHKTLPCGSLVDVTYAGRTISVPVIDRGPYAHGVSYDLTLATARALGMVSAGRARVGVLPQARAHAEVAARARTGDRRRRRRHPLELAGTRGSGQRDARGPRREHALVRVRHERRRDRSRRPGRPRCRSMRRARPPAASPRR